MNNKFSQWTITLMDKDGYHYVYELDTNIEVLEVLKELQENGQDMNYINVFPPKSDLTLEEIINY